MRAGAKTTAGSQTWMVAVWGVDIALKDVQYKCLPKWNEGELYSSLQTHSVSREETWKLEVVMQRFLGSTVAAKGRDATGSRGVKDQSKLRCSLLLESGSSEC